MSTQLNLILCDVDMVTTVTSLDGVKIAVLKSGVWNFACSFLGPEREFDMHGTAVS